MVWIKKKLQNCICKFCNSSFMCADVKGNVCENCKLERKICPDCNSKKEIVAKRCFICSQKYKTGGNLTEEQIRIRNKRIKDSGEKQSFIIKGLSKEEIIKLYPKWMNCGYKKGKDNIAKQPNIQEKISYRLIENYKNNPEIKVKKVETRRKTFVSKPFKIGHFKCVNSRGEKFRSILEQNFSELLIKNNIDYKYETVIRLHDNSIKIVDFIVNDIVIEISGYAYESWRRDFNKKMKLLRESIDNQIIVLNYPENLEDIYSVVTDKNIYVGDIYNQERIISTIKFCESINKMNRIEMEDMKI